METQYGRFLDRMKAFIIESGIRVTDEIRSCAEMCSKALEVAITENNPVLRALHDSQGKQPLSPEIVLNSQTANHALELFRLFLREEVAGRNFAILLNDSEKLTFDELLTAFGMFAGDKDALFEFVSKRDYMRNISCGSPLRPLISCILEKRDNYAEVLELEVKQSGHEPNNPHSDHAIALMSKFEVLLQGCMNSGSNGH